MASNPATTQALVLTHSLAQQAPHGQRQAIYADACLRLGMSLPTLHRHLAQVVVRTQRRQRSDVGEVLLPRTEAIAISAVLQTSHRKTGKRLMPIEQAVDLLRANGEVRAQRLDASTGELLPLSTSAIARALRHYKLHPDQLNRPEPAVELRSLHPNHVWQIDASLCVLYYLRATSDTGSGLQVMQHDQFYKNKPANLKRIEADRVWSYEVTDHYSGALFVHYVLGAESGTNLAESFIEAISLRAGDPLHGVPLILMMDMGSANTSGLFATLARRLQVKLIAHSPGNARATGQVENARNLIERGLESGLKLRPVADLAELNAQAQRWAKWFNANRIHSRHGKTRYDMWLTIGQDQLRIAPPRELCQELLTHTPEHRKVSVQMTVNFKGREYNVKDVPGVMVGEKLHITYNPYQLDAALVLDTTAEGAEALHSIPVVTRNEAGFRDDANVIDEDYARPATTQLEHNRREVQRFAYEAATDEEVAAKIKAKATPFGGRIDPFKVIEQAPERTFLPKLGTVLQTAVKTASATAPPQILQGFALALALKERGVVMSRERNAQVAAWYPDGVPESDLPALVARLSVRAGLRLVNGAAP